MLQHHTGIVMLDKASRLAFFSTPKAGTTTACQVMFAHTGQLEVAKGYKPPPGSSSPWPNYQTDWEHNYFEEVWARQPDHHIPRSWTCKTSCGKTHAQHEPLACVKLLRWPMRRVVSSYLYAMGDEGFLIGQNWWMLRRVVLSSAKGVNQTFSDATGGKIPARPYDPRIAACSKACHTDNPPRHGRESSSLERCMVRCATFEHMIAALEASAEQERKAKWRSFICWDHIFPQTDTRCDLDLATRSATTYLPLETISHGLRALQTVANFTFSEEMISHTSAKQRVNGTTYNTEQEKVPLPTANRSSAAGHGNRTAKMDVARTPYSELLALYGKGKSPPYRLFLADPQIRERVRILFSRDLTLYDYACRQPILDSSACAGRCRPAHCADPILLGLPKLERKVDS